MWGYYQLISQGVFSAVEIGGAYQFPHARPGIYWPGRRTIIREDNGEILIGPDSVGYRLTEEALVFEATQ